MKKLTQRAVMKPRIEHFLTVAGQYVIVGGKRLAPQDIANLKAEAEAIRNTKVWKILHENVERDAKQRIFEKAVSIHDLNFGKAILYTTDLQDRILDAIIMARTSIPSPLTTYNVKT